MITLFDSSRAYEWVLHELKVSVKTIPKEINDEISSISGLVNLNLYWDRTKEVNKSLVRKLVRKKASRRFPGGPGPPSNHTKALHTVVLPDCAQPSVSGVIKTY